MKLLKRSSWNSGAHHERASAITGDSSVTAWSQTHRDSLLRGLDSLKRPGTRCMTRCGARMTSQIQAELQHFSPL
ncbi:hypothetical protein AMECASPLE_030011 [Ameca splendens]|uniref:Uncharacterized protein n=1 Tax=Ameca splendens TaxID=208324 RepID=A0ABV0Z5D9_9TELE